MTAHFQPYSMQSAADNGGYTLSHERFAVRVGGSGGRIIGRDFGLNRQQASELCELLEQAYALGAQTLVQS